MIQEKAGKILVVDDDDQSIFLLQHLFKKYPYEIAVAHSGDNALSKAREFEPDLILLDILMPEIDGLEVCRKLKSDGTLKSIPVIFITSIDNTDQLVKGFDAGAVDYITKPFNKHELRARVRTHLELKKSGDIISDQNIQLKKEIEERRQSEEKSRALSQAAFEAVLFIQNNLIIESNDAAMAIFGIREKELTGKPVTALLPEVAKEKVSGILQSPEQGPWELPFLNKNNEIFYGQVKHQGFIYRGQQINVLAISDVTRLKELEKGIQTAIVETEEREKRRFAMDVHDGLGALLSTLKIYVTLLQKENKSEEDRTLLLNELKSNINEALHSAKSIANNLMPSTLEDYGLLPALDSFSKTVLRSGTIDIHITSEKNLPPLNKNTEINLYRICTELINNTLKHANAEKINVKISTAGKSLKLQYQDDGKGFDPGKLQRKGNGGHGLKNIMTRIQFLNGNLQFKSPGKGGTNVQIEIPVN